MTPPDIGVPSLQGTGVRRRPVRRPIWTEATDANPAGATKPVWMVACGSEQLVYVNAVPTRVQFGNMESRFAPEQVAANTQQAIAVSRPRGRARAADAHVRQLEAGACRRSTWARRGTSWRASICSSSSTSTRTGSRGHRRFTAVFPAWAKGVIRADLAREIGARQRRDRPTSLAITDAQIDDWFTIAGRQRHLDARRPEGRDLRHGRPGDHQSVLPAARRPPGAAPQWPGQSGERCLHAGLVPVRRGDVPVPRRRPPGPRGRAGLASSTQRTTTRPSSRSFEGVAFRGLEALQVQSTIKPTGDSAIPVDRYVRGVVAPISSSPGRDRRDPRNPRPGPEPNL